MNTAILLFILASVLFVANVEALSISPKDRKSMNSFSRRSFVASTSAAAALAVTGSLPSKSQAVQVYNTPNGIKYAVLKEGSSKAVPQSGDIVAVDYTGYLTNGQIFDATHSEGKKNNLLFKLGSGSVIPGLDEIVSGMNVGQKVQAIIPAKFAYGDKGVCLENGECLVKPNETLVYDVFLIKSSIPPP